MRRVYDEENMPYEDAEEEFDGYTVVDDHSIFNVGVIAAVEPKGWASPLPENETTVILFEPNVRGVKDGDKLKLQFDGENCSVHKTAKIGILKPAFVKKLIADRGGTPYEAFYKASTPPMVRLVFGTGDPLPKTTD